MNPLVESPVILDTPEVPSEAQSVPIVESPRLVLPPWTDAAAFVATPKPPPPEIISGVLHQGCKLVLGGSSKAFKSWTLLDMALAVSTGSKWLNFQTAKARVLFVNFELPEFSIHHRLRAIAEARKIEIPPEALCLWNLRGHAASYETLLPLIGKRIKGSDFGLVILDPSYKLLGQADENSARDIALLLNALEKLAVETGVAIAFTAHFAKGSAAHKEAIDRISGSGVFARDPDSILVFTALETEKSFAVESVLRTLPPQKKFAVRWDYPFFQLADDLDPGDLKQPQRANTKTVPTAEQVLSVFPTSADQPHAALFTAVQLRALFDARGWDRTAAPAVRDSLIAEGKLKMYHGAHNSKLTGLPAVVDAYVKQRAEAETLLEQPALPVKHQKPRRHRK